MRLGDLDGLRVVYDRQGRPILEVGESLETERTATALALYEGKRAKGQPLLHHDQGDVGCTMTDRRLIVLIDPSLETARRVLQLPGGESYSKGMELFEVILGHGRYYLVLEWSEIPKIKVPSEKRSTATFAVGPTEGSVHTPHGGQGDVRMDRAGLAQVPLMWSDTIKITFLYPRVTHRSDGLL